MHESNPLDPRVVRTRQLIRDSFLELVQEVDFNKITVNLITKRAGINRVTFYLHYMDLPDMVEKMVDERIKFIETIFLDKYDEPYSPSFELETLIELLEHIAQNAKLFKVFLVTKHIPSFTQQLMELLRKLILQNSNQEQAFPAMEDIPRDIAAWYGTSAMVGTIALWLGEDMPYTPQYLAQIMVKLNPFR